ncbi:hypothetical protein H9623_16875 [Oerskovia sp. Sa1BUA8]|uniref:Uncharacterized protein n=1 Tax=Oerskovia douganii TaxID=2762210 RepID=A0A9D5UK29_9CELL|nr:hypothetical protein [Oerskovia douganii]MBE7701967.1 hypothetical protein [Oerskovia douganii]
MTGRTRRSTRGSGARVRAAVRPVVLAAACAVGVTVVAGCGVGEPQRQRVEWVLAAQDGATLEIGVSAGGSTCTDDDGIEVAETDGTVEVRAYVLRTAGACSEDLGVREVTVELDEPLGGRDLVGCAGRDVTVGAWDLAADADCAEPRPGLLPGRIDVPVG